MDKKCCKTCKYGQITFGSGLKEELQVWECNATVLIVPASMRSTFPVSTNHWCDWWNKPKETIEEDLKILADAFAEARKMEKGVSLGKVVKKV